MGISTSPLGLKEAGRPWTGPPARLLLFLGQCPFLEASTRRSTQLQAEGPKLTSQGFSGPPRVPPEACVCPIRTRELVVAC